MDKDSTQNVEESHRRSMKALHGLEKAYIESGAGGNPLYGIGTVQDITDRRQLEQRLQDIINLDKKIVNVSPIGIIAFRADGPCIPANPSMAHIKGTRLERALTLNFHNLDTWKENGLYDKVMTVLDTREAQSTEINLTTTFGNNVWLKFIIAPFKK